MIEKQPVFAVEPNLYKALNVKHGADRATVDEAYRSVLKHNRNHEQISYLAWKVLRDPWYAELYQKHRSLQYLYEAGFFIDAIPLKQIDRLDFVPGFMTTPVHKLQYHVAQNNEGKLVVLVTTGGLSPITHGHIAMMEVARDALSKRGYTVIGGYFSPSHDDYVSTKYGGEAELNSDHRIYLSQLAVQESDWLMVDPWEARFVPTDINFTDVIRHLKAYINHYIEAASPIEVFYVFGGDNAKFARAFKNHGGCVCIARDNPQHLDVESEDGIKDNPRIVFTQNLSSYAQTSSSAARKWKMNLMPEAVSTEYFKWRKNILLAEGGITKPKQIYVIRDEDDWAIEPWMAKFGDENVLNAKQNFRRQLLHALQNVFAYVLRPDLSLEIETRVYHLDDQHSYVRRLERQEKILNLDICTNNGTGINASRLFYPCDGQLRPSRLIGRPGFAHVEAQIENIAPGDYTLVDDDIATGSTINMLMGMLPESVKIRKMRTLIDQSRIMYAREHLDSFDQNAFDVVDLRDFILGSRASGLVVQLPNGTIARAPYLQPYISLISRASIPPSSEMTFSKRLWELNREFFTSINGPVLISDLDEYVQTLFIYLGFETSMSVTDLCTWHLEKIYGDADNKASTD